MEARIGASPHGQGLDTTLSQIAADELGIAPDRIRITHGDTDRTPYGFGTFASRSLVIAGGATLMAARKIGAKLRIMAGHLLEATPGDIVLGDGMARVAGTDREVPVAAVARMAYHQAHKFGHDLAPGLAASATYDPPGTFSNACHMAVVSVDVDTGKVTLERLLVVEDAGLLINPMRARSTAASPRASRARSWKRSSMTQLVTSSPQPSPTISCPPRGICRPSTSITWRRCWIHSRSPGRRASAKAARYRRARRDPQRHQRCAVAVRRIDRGASGHAATRPRGIAEGA